MNKPLGSKIKTKISVVKNSKIETRSDYLATEEPLQIRLDNLKQTLAITMRTPGADFDLAAGFLYSEGAIRNREDIEKINYCLDSQSGSRFQGRRDLEAEQGYNIVNVSLKPGLLSNLPALERHFFTTSACGVCGKANIESLKIKGYSQVASNLIITPQIIYNLPDRLRQAQGIFTATGGLHAAALFDRAGQLLKLREDVGRHNALDKLIGSAFLADELPLNNSIVMVSGRSSFELVQKCIVAGVPILCSVSAPSSLAVSLAKEFELTLIGFLRGERFNIYSGIKRISI